MGTALKSLLHTLTHTSTRAPLPLEYYSLPPETKAELLSTLCDDLLDVPTVIAEFERREIRGEMVTGEGGAGSMIHMRVKAAEV